MSKENKIVLITGAAKRIGKEIALSMADAGWDIAIHYGKSKEEASQTIQEIKAKGRKAIALQADLSNEQEVEALLPECLKKLGVPSCIINNASLFEYDDPKTVNYKNVENHFKVNLSAPLIIARDYYKLLLKGSQSNVLSGVLIQLLDQKIENLNPDFFSYTLSKGALEMATVMMAQAYAPILRVVAIAPGITLTSGEQTDKGFEEAHKLTPLGKSSSPNDIAEGVIYLANAKAVTGITLFVDGGQHLTPSKRDVMFLTSN